MINSFLGAEFDIGDDNDTIITRQLDGTAALTYTVTAQVNSLVCHSLSLSPGADPEGGFLGLQPPHMVIVTI